MLEGEVFGDSFVFLAVGEPVHLADHVEELLTVLHLDVAEEVAQEVHHRKQTSVYGLSVRLWLVLHPVHLPTLAGLY